MEKGRVLCVAAAACVLIAAPAHGAGCGDWDNSGSAGFGDIFAAVNWGFVGAPLAADTADADVNGDCHLDYGDIIVTVEGILGGGALNCTCNVASTCAGTGQPDTLRIGTVSGAPGDIVLLPVYAWSDATCDWIAPLTINSTDFDADSIFFGPFASPTSASLIGPGPDFLAHSSQSSGPTGTRFKIQPGLNELFQIRIAIDPATATGFYPVDSTFIAPAHIVKFFEDNGVTCVLPEVVSGGIEVIDPGNAPDCDVSGTGTNFLYACPSGGVPFTVEILTADGQPVEGYSDVQLDFTDCSLAEVVPLASEYPTWPIVPAPEPSDADGIIRFAIAAVGDCPDCLVSVVAGCGTIATLPVRTGDVDLDSAVTPLDFLETLGDCRDLNADGVVDHFDFEMHTMCLGSSFPAGPCDRLEQTITLDPDAGFEPDDVVTLTWTVTNNNTDVSCTIDNVDFFHAELSSNPSWQLFGNLTPGITLDPGESYSFTFFSYVIPDFGGLALKVEMSSDCCVTPQELIVQRDIRRACPPDSICYEFVAVIEPALDTTITVQLPDMLDWSWDTISIDTIPNGLLVTICTSDFTPLGVSGGININLCYGIPCIGADLVTLEFRVLHDWNNGDVNNDCAINVLDVVYLIAYVFRSGPEPEPVEHGDVTCDWPDGILIVNVLDVVYLIDYVFRSGPPPPECIPFPGEDAFLEW